MPKRIKQEDAAKLGAIDIGGNRVEQIKPKGPALPSPESALLVTVAGIIRQLTEAMKLAGETQGSAMTKLVESLEKQVAETSRLMDQMVEANKVRQELKPTVIEDHGHDDNIEYHFQLHRDNSDQLDYITATKKPSMRH